MLTIIKVGGNLIEKESDLDKLLSAFSKIEGEKILVHGGGRRATAVAKKMNITSKMHEGRRITDEASLEVATMVYAGLVNKTIVAKLQAKACNAIGLTGADGNLISSKKRDANNRFGVDFGFVGDVEKVDSKGIDQLLKAGFIPVFNAITHDEKGQLLNTNADTIATEIAKAMASIYKIKLLYCFEKEGVLTDVEDASTCIKALNESQYNDLKQEQTIFEGMIPKLDNAFDAKVNGVEEVIIGSIDAIENKALGTRII